MYKDNTNTTGTQLKTVFLIIPSGHKLHTVPVCDPQTEVNHSWFRMIAHSSPKYIRVKLDVSLELHSKMPLLFEPEVTMVFTLTFNLIGACRQVKT